MDTQGCFEALGFIFSWEDLSEMKKKETPGLPIPWAGRELSGSVPATLRNLRLRTPKNFPRVVIQTD
jgi:hypothetical protein